VTGDRSQPDRSQPALAPLSSAPGAPAQPASAQHYARDRRIVKTDEFSSVFRLRPARRTDHFVLYIRNNGLTTARLGIVVAKRLAPRAVTRNMVKRITRELFRQTALPAVDCVVRLSKPINRRTDPAASSRLKKCLRSELQELLAFPHRMDSSR
jgi:ribonuclease P protein component